MSGETCGQGFRSSGPSPTTVHLLGIGKVGRAFLALLEGSAFRVVGASDSTATVYDRRGLPPAELASFKASGRRLADWSGAEPLPSTLAVAAVGADVVVDATATTGGDAARSRGEAALRAGSALVLAAKDGLRAAGAGWLLGPAAERIGYNAVLGGTGLRLRSELDGLRARCDEVALVANASSSAILDEIARGAGLEEGIARARRRGLLEADPTRDLDGSDATDKLCIVASALWGEAGGKAVDARSVERQDLRALDPQQVRRAAARGRVARLVARGRRAGPLRVAVEWLPPGSPLAAPPDRVVYGYSLPEGLRVHIGTGLGELGTAAALWQDLAAREAVR